MDVFILFCVAAFALVGFLSLNDGSDSSILAFIISLVMMVFSVIMLDFYNKDDLLNENEALKRKVEMYKSVNTGFAEELTTLRKNLKTEEEPSQENLDPQVSEIISADVATFAPEIQLLDLTTIPDMKKYVKECFSVKVLVSDIITNTGYLSVDDGSVIKQAIQRCELQNLMEEVNSTR